MKWGKVVTIPERVIRKIETIMAGEVRKKPSFLSLLFLAVSVSYGGIVRLRENLYKKKIIKPKRLPCPVISVGNITVGGSGKTPMTIYIAQLIQQMGYDVTIISRGYKGKVEKTGGIVCDGNKIYIGPDDAGDEPIMMARRLKNIPIIVGKNRYRAGMLAIKEFVPDVLLLDDAFQHLKLKRDIDLVLLDNSSPFGNGCLFPKGTLREPISAISRGDAVILTRSDLYNKTALVKLKKMVKSKPVFQSTHVPYVHKIIQANRTFPRPETRSLDKYEFDIFNGKRAFAFSGIANNDDFRQTIENFNCKLIGFLDFPDHYRYSTKELDKILDSAMALSADFILTTEKDYTRLTQETKWSLDLAIIGVEISFGENAIAFQSFIKRRLEELFVSYGRQTKLQRTSQHEC